MSPETPVDTTSARCVTTPKPRRKPETTQNNPSLYRTSNPGLQTLVWCTGWGGEGGKTVPLPVKAYGKVQELSHFHLCFAGFWHNRSTQLNARKLHIAVLRDVIPCCTCGRWLPSFRRRKTPLSSGWKEERMLLLNVCAHLQDCTVS